MAKRSHPTIDVVTDSDLFWEEVSRWPHEGFHLAKVRPSSTGRRVQPAWICFGPDLSAAQFGVWRRKFPKSSFLWAKEAWSVEELAGLKPADLSGFFLDLRDRKELSAVWQRAFTSRPTAKPHTKKDGKPAGRKLESLMSFIKAVAGANDVFELLGLLREQLRSFKVAGDPILLLHKAQPSSELFYFRGKETHARKLHSVPAASLRVRVHDSGDRQFLANQLGRPFGKVIAFPLAQEKSSGWEIHPFIFIEHRMEDAELPQFINDIAQPLQAVSLVLDRLVLENELKRASVFWEKTFDGIDEPIAIVGLDEEIVRSNRHFTASGLTGSEKGLVKIKDALFKVEKFDIRIKDRGPVLSTVVHYHNVTKPMNLREQMIQLEKMSAVGHLAGHIAHELNNPLTGIRSLAQILLREMEKEKSSATLIDDLGELEKASQRCQQIILNLLEFSRGNLDAKTRRCDLNEIISKTLPFLKSAMGRISYQIELQPSPLMVEVEPQLMQQVVFNLVNNACQALGETNGRLDVRTSEQSFGNKRFAVLSVKDDGPGVPRELLDLIFEPFFTTKREGEGTGLGLSFSRDFVRRLGGDIVCKSEHGHGAEFRVLLPLALAESLGEEAS